MQVFSDTISSLNPGEAETFDGPTIIPLPGEARIVSCVSAVVRSTRGRTMEADAQFSRHARERMQQRGISRQAIEYVLAYGRVSHDHRGSRVVWLDKRARARLYHREGRNVVSSLDKHLNTYAVMDGDGVVVTVGHRYRRIWRH